MTLIKCPYLQLTTTTPDVFTCMKTTLLEVQSKNNTTYNVVDVTKEALQQLIDLKLVVQKRSLSQDTEAQPKSLEVTPLGRATFKGEFILFFAVLYPKVRITTVKLVLLAHMRRSLK